MLHSASFKSGRLLDQVTKRFLPSLWSYQWNIKSATFSNTSSRKKTSLSDYLSDKIRTTGPISVAEFMKTTLTNVESGYYMHKDMLGEGGDFVTSPELSQMFGELIAVWILNEWTALGKPKTVRIVELGPGRGTLCVDMMRTFKELSHVWSELDFSLHLVEVSPTLRSIQHQRLCCETLELESNAVSSDEGRCNAAGMPISWYKDLDEVPSGECTFFVAHEFFDALPVHKFAKRNEAWKEVYVDVDRSSESKFRFVVLPQQTLACKTLIQANESRKQVEVSPESALICQKISRRIADHTGAALIADYGHLGTKEDTLRAFKQHTVVDVLDDIGNCDITADVDFKYLIDTLKGCDVITTGPISQRLFLQNMGIDTRLMMLLRSTKDEEVRRKLIGSYDVMMNKEKMGERFQFLAITSKQRQHDESFHKITGFS